MDSWECKRPGNTRGTGSALEPDTHLWGQRSTIAMLHGKQAVAHELVVADEHGSVFGRTLGRCRSIKGVPGINLYVQQLPVPLSPFRNAGDLDRMNPTFVSASDESTEA